MTKIFLTYRFRLVAVFVFGDRTQVNQLTAFTREVLVVIRHVAVNGVGTGINVSDFDPVRNTGNALERMCFFLLADPNSEADLVTFDLDADGFRYVPEDFAMRGS